MTNFDEYPTGGLMYRKKEKERFPIKPLEEHFKLNKTS